MDTLPTELIRLMLEELDQDDIPNVRLVSRKYAAIGIYHLPTRNAFVLRRHSLARLQRIVEHPILCGMLTDITFYVDIAPDFQKLEDWQRQAKGVIEPRPGYEQGIAQKWLRRYTFHQVVPMNQLGLDRLFIGAGWAEHQNMRHEQTEMLRNNETIVTLSKIFRRLINLKMFTLLHLELLERPSRRQLYVNRVSQPWYCYNSMHTPEDDHLSGARLFNALLQPHATDSSLGRVAALFSMFDYFGIAATHFSMYNNHITQVDVQIIRCLKTLCLIHIDQPGKPWPTEPTDPWSVVPSRDLHTKDNMFILYLLEHLVSIEALYLEVALKPQLHTDSLFEAKRWPNLRILQLASIDIGRKSFEAFLFRHASSIQVLVLDTCTIKDPFEKSWIRLLQYIACNMDLNSLELKECLYEDYGNASGTTELRTDARWLSSCGVLWRAKDIAHMLVCRDGMKGLSGTIKREMSWESFEVAYEW